MSICTIYSNTGMSAERYAETRKRLEAAGAGQPQGQLYHVCFGDTDNLSVIDVFESQETFEAFGQVLRPILEELNLGQVQPEVSQVHNIG
jgi:hypothetical protein